jgi:integrase/recombinase XerD
MNNLPAISIYLDTRRQKQSGKYPVKLRIFTQSPRIQKLYPTDFEFTKDEFQSIWETTKPRKEHKESRLKLQQIESEAIETAKNINPFSFELFKKAITKAQTIDNDVILHYTQRVKELNKNKQIGTAETYSLALKSFKAYLIDRNGKEPKTLPFETITVQWLNDYENYLTGEKGLSNTTLSMYVRTLRTLFNNAIFEKTVSAELYPFGKRKYQIPATKSVKKALSKEQLKKLFETEPKTPEQQKAKDFWFLSYFCNGMNVKDILNLKYKNISGEFVSFYRAKTKKTIKQQKPISIYLNDFTNEVINKYGNQSKNPESYIFDFIDRTQKAEQQHKQLKNFIRFINQHFKKFAESNGIKENVSTYWARHSFATTAIRNGANMELLSESLGHENLKTTLGYFAGFETETKKELSKKLLQF